MRDEEGVRRFVEHMAMLWADLGFPKMPARILMAMMAAEQDALTAAELGERLEVSPAAISGAVRYLIQIGMLQRHPTPGTRHNSYRLTADAWYEVSLAKDGQFKKISDIAQDGISAVGGDAKSSARMAEMRDFFAFMEVEMAAILDKWKQSRTRSI
ncbi:MAG: helix-turn-helix domain-containing protein [Streptosporangiaceae bacterium]